MKTLPNSFAFSVVKYFLCLRACSLYLAFRHKVCTILKDFHIIRQTFQKLQSLPPHENNMLSSAKLHITDFSINKKSLIKILIDLSINPWEISLLVSHHPLYEEWVFNWLIITKLRLCYQDHLVQVSLVKVIR